MVGASGISGEGFAVETASSLSLPAFTAASWVSDEVVSSIFTSPFITAMVDGPWPL